MRNTNLLTLTAALLLQAGLAAAEPPAANEAPTELEPLIVYPSTLPLDEPARLLRLLVLRSTPCLGCDAVLRQPTPSPAAVLLQYLLVPSPPPEVDESRRLALDLKLQDAPDLDYLRP